MANHLSEILNPYQYINSKWYAKKYLGDSALHTQSLSHYLTQGWKLAHDPHPLFSTSYYLGLYPELQQYDISPLTHYLKFGVQKHASTHPLFEARYYATKYPEAAKYAGGSFLHFLEVGIQNGYDPHPLFQTATYLSNLKLLEVEKPDEEPAFLHYLKTGWKLEVSPHPFFSISHYLHVIGGVLKLNGLDPLSHYLTVGRYRGYTPTDRFDPVWYRYQARELNIAPQDLLLTYAKTPSEKRGTPNFMAEVSRWIASSNDSAGSNADGIHCVNLPSNVSTEELVRKVMAEPQNSPQAALLHQRLIVHLLSGENRERLHQASPLVSIVLPTFNRLDVLSKAIESVLQQSYPHWELLIVDDGSTDATPELLEKYTANDSRIRTILGNHSGISNARNRGLECAKGQYISYLDSDNLWEHWFLETSLSYLLATQKTLCYSAWMNGTGAQCTYRFTPYSRYNLVHDQNFIDLNVIVHHRRLYDTHGGFDPELRRFVDWDLLIRYTAEEPPAQLPLVGAWYDNQKHADRITVVESNHWLYVIKNKHQINWHQEELKARDAELISIITCVYGQPELTKAYVESVYENNAGRRFELILVDNNSDQETQALFDKLVMDYPQLRTVRNSSNLQFALGNNVGFTYARGATVVFVNNDILVEEGWLAALVRNLNLPAVGAIQPKLIYPDGTLQHMGAVFSQENQFAIQLYRNLSIDSPSTRTGRPLHAVSGACMAMRALDFAKLKGFDPSFVNGQEDIDLCLRLLQLPEREFNWYEAECTIVHAESKSAGRGLKVLENRRIFAERWKGKLPQDADWHYAFDGLKPTELRIDHPNRAGSGLEIYHPIFPANPTFPTGAVPMKFPGSGAKTSLHFAIKIGCPRADQRMQWGDYHFATCLGEQLNALGHTYRIDYLKQWDHSTPNDINVVLRGLSKFHPEPSARLNLMWIISHPESITPEELTPYDHIFVASEKFTKHLIEDFSCKKVSTLLQCTDPQRFFPGRYDQALAHDVLYVGNSRKVRRAGVKLAIEAGLNPAVYGTLWEGLIPDHYVKAPCILNSDLGAYYSSAGVVINDHWDDMRQHGFISNRLFDVLASGRPIVSDHIEDVPPSLLAGVRFFNNADSLTQATHDAMQIDAQQLKEIACAIHQNHSFKRRALELIAQAQTLLNSI